MYEAKRKLLANTTGRKQVSYQSHKNYLLQSIVGYDVIIFHVKDMPGSKLLNEINRLRPIGQLWAYYTKESPFNTINLIDGKYDGMFNLTITPLRNSDVFAPYGYYEKKRMKSARWIKNINPNVIFR